MAREIPINDQFRDGFYEALARVIVEFGRFEYLVKLCVKDLSEKGFDAGLLEAQSITKFRRLCNRALDIANEKLNADEYSEFDRIMEEASSLAIYRNDSVHACWTTENGTQLRVRPVKKDDVVDWTRSRSVDVTELRAKAEEIRQLFLELNHKRLQWSVRVNAD